MKGKHFNQILQLKLPASIIVCCLFTQRRDIASVNGYAIVYEFDGKKKVNFIESRNITTKVLRDLRPFTNYTARIRPRCEMGFALCTVPVKFMTRGDRKCLTHCLSSICYNLQNFIMEFDWLNINITLPNPLLWIENKNSFYKTSSFLGNCRP